VNNFIAVRINEVSVCVLLGIDLVILVCKVCWNFYVRLGVGRDFKGLGPS